MIDPVASGKNLSHQSGGSPTSAWTSGHACEWNAFPRRRESPTVVNPLNQVTSDGTSSYSCDANGNLTTKSWANGALYYSWDDENQLARVETDTYYTPEAYRWRTDFVYDGRGRLRKRNDYVWQYGGWYGSGGETRYVYDGPASLALRRGKLRKRAHGRLHPRD
jgi:YD repeat-containing protein